MWCRLSRIELFSQTSGGEPALGYKIAAGWEPLGDNDYRNPTK